ncbi:MAG: chlorophyll synthesis pathway protein BchC [Pseudomonadota bacterium]
MQTRAVYLKGPRDLDVAVLPLTAPGPRDLVVEVSHSGISTGTEKLFWTGQMPPFPGSGWPLVPGYEATGEVVEAGSDTGFSPGEHVFVPGANCFEGAFALFGGAAERIVTDVDRVVRIDSGPQGEGALLALAATAWHAMSGQDKKTPDLIVGHGVLGRLIARLAVATGAGAPPVVWETNPARRGGALGYQVLSPDEDPRRDYSTIYDASGNVEALDQMIGRLARGGELVLAGFYPEGVRFAFPPAFMREARLRISAEWAPEDLRHVRDLVRDGALSLDGLISHTRPASEAKEAYAEAFNSPDCLKMMLSWRDAA